MSWHQIHLGDAVHIKHGYAFKSEYFADSGSLFVLTPGNFHEEGGFRQRPSKDRAYIGDIPDGYVLSAGDLIVAMTEQGPGLLGSSALVPESDRFLHNQRLGLIDSINESKLNKHFLYYLFNTHAVRAQISGSASGTKVRHTSPDRIYRVTASVPNVATQKSIAKTLAGYDDLIENSRRRMTLLEDAARQLYREWFVRLRFPGHEHTRIVDGVPEGWEQQPISDLVLGIYDGPHATPPEADEGPVFLGIKNIAESGRLDLSTVRHIAENDFPRWTKRALPQAGDIVFSYEATLHRYALIPEGFRGCLGRRLALIRPDPSRKNGLFLFQTLLSERWRSTIEANIISGATVDRIPIKKLPSFPVLVPPDRLVQLFEENVRDIFLQVQTLAQQADKLRTARDLLLPRLMSGEIAV